jgi:hypothetical protein
VNLCFQQGLSRKPSRRTYSSKQITFIHSETDVEDSRRPQKTLHWRLSWDDDIGGWLAPPTCRPAYGTHVSASPSNVGSPSPPKLHLHRSFKSVWFEGLELMLRSPTPPSSDPRNPNSYLSSISTYTKGIRSRALQCSRLVAREWRSSWAHAQVSDLVLEARRSLVSLLLHFVRLIINLSYSYLHGYAYFEYISCLVMVTFVCGFMERLAC